MRQAALLVALVCLLVAASTGAVGATGPSSLALQDDATEAPSGVDVTVQVQDDGTARWNVSTTYALEDDNDTAAFDQLRQSFEAGEAAPEFSVDVFRAVVPTVSERVNRTMEIREPSRSSRVVEHGNNSTGVLSLQFTWTNFARVENGDADRLVVDSFGGGWFGDLEANQTLTIRPPEGYDTDEVQPGPDSITDGAYEWTGPRAFGAGEPFVAFTPTGTSVGVSMVVLVAVVALAVVAGAASVWAYYRGEPALSWLRRVRETVAGDTGSATTGVEEPAEPEGQEPGSESASTAGAGATSREESDVDPELLSDEERVERLLREHGGRMKQSKIVEETRWSTAKVSQLLSSMADDGRVEKLRIGRENLISLPGEGVDDE